jgi:hypothetical protein
MFKSPPDKQNTTSHAHAKWPIYLVLALAPVAYEQAFAAEQKVVAMYVNSGNANSEEIAPGVPTSVDQTTITCPKPTCTLALTAMQAIEDGNGSIEWSILATVDGNPVGSPNYQGFLPNNNYLTGNWQGNYAVRMGQHLVTFQIFGEANFILDSWSDTVAILTP